jgi:hypothetical protein
MVFGLQAVYRQQAGSYGGRAFGCFVGACLQAMVGGLQAVYRQQAGSYGAGVLGLWGLMINRPGFLIF